jgi:hypothetical protein
MEALDAATGGRRQLDLLTEDVSLLMDALTASTPDGSWLQEAAVSLLTDPICLNSAGWVNGQHRAQAAIDAGARRLLVECCDGFKPRVKRSWRDQLSHIVRLPGGRHGRRRGHRGDAARAALSHNP